MRSTSGRSIEQRRGAAPRVAPSGPSTSERLRLGPEWPPVPGGPQRSPRRGGTPGTVPGRGRRHFNYGSKGGPGGYLLSLPWLSSVFRELRCHSDFQSESVFCKVQGRLSWVGTRSPRTLEGKNPPVLPSRPWSVSTASFREKREETL